MRPRGHILAAFLVLGVSMAADPSVASVAVPAGGGLTARPDALYDIPFSHDRADTALVPELLVVIRNTGERPVVLLSADGRQPRYIIQCFQGPRRRPGEPINCPLEVVPPLRLVLQGGDSLFLGVGLLSETKALRIRLFTESTSGWALSESLSDTIEMADTPTRRLIAGGAAARAALSAVPHSELSVSEPRLETSPKYGKVWVVRLRTQGTRRTALVSAFTADVLAVMERPTDDW